MVDLGALVAKGRQPFQAQRATTSSRGPVWAATANEQGLFAPCHSPSDRIPLYSSELRFRSGCAHLTMEPELYKKSSGEAIMNRWSATCSLCRGAETRTTRSTRFVRRIRALQVRGWRPIRLPKTTRPPILAGHRDRSGLLLSETQ